MSTLREQAAIAAMQGIRTNTCDRCGAAGMQSHEVARWAIADADALLAELARTAGPGHNTDGGTLPSRANDPHFVRMAHDALNLERERDEARALVQDVVRSGYDTQSEKRCGQALARWNEAAIVRKGKAAQERWDGIWADISEQLGDLERDRDEARALVRRWRDWAEDRSPHLQTVLNDTLAAIARWDTEGTA